MDNVTIQARPREGRGSTAAKRLRQDGLVPCIVYGHKQANLQVAVNEHDLRLALRSGAHFFGMNVEGQGDESVLVKEVQLDALGDRILHVDFMRIALDETVEVTVPIVTTGQAKGVLNKGVLDQPVKEIDVVGLAGSIPDEIRVPIAALDIGDHLTIADIKLPEGVTTEADPEQVVVVIHPPTAAEEVEEVEAAEGAAEPEIIGRKAEDEEEAEETPGKK